MQKPLDYRQLKTRIWQLEKQVDRLATFIAKYVAVDPITYHVNNTATVDDKTPRLRDTWIDWSTQAWNAYY